MSNIVILFGSPGSGKGELCKGLIEAFGFKPLATGELIRSHIGRGTVIGNIAMSHISKGRLVPNEIIIPLALKSLQVILAEKLTPILDGFPRDSEQTEQLHREIRRLELMPIILSLEVDQSVCTRRILEIRRQNALSAGEQARVDDTPEAVERRMKEFLEVTIPGIHLLVDTFPSRSYPIDASRDILAVRHQAIRTLEKLGLRQPAAMPQ